MDIELQEKLYEKYPKMFKDFTRTYDKDEILPPGAFGIECGDGWYTLIDTLCERIQNHDNQFPTDVYVEQVKEKYGGLRFYIRGGDDRIHGMISLAESLSYEICERCGSMNNVSQTDGWIKTLCEDCMARNKDD